MSRVPRPEQLHRGLGLRECGDEVRHRGLQVRVEPAAAERSALADAGVHDDPVEPALQVGVGQPEHLEHLLVVGHVQRMRDDGDPRVPGSQFVLQRLQPVLAARRQRQVVALGGELPRHLLAEPGTRPGDQDVASHGESYLYDEQVGAVEVRVVVEADQRQSAAPRHELGDPVLTVTGLSSQPQVVAAGEQPADHRRDRTARGEHHGGLPLAQPIRRTSYCVFRAAGRTSAKDSVYPSPSLRVQRSVACAEHLLERPRRVTGPSQIGQQYRATLVRRLVRDDHLVVVELVEPLVDHHLRIRPAASSARLAVRACRCIAPATTRSGLIPRLIKRLAQPDGLALTLRREPVVVACARTTPARAGPGRWSPLSGR